MPEAAHELAELPGGKLRRTQFVVFEWFTCDLLHYVKELLATEGAIPWEVYRQLALDVIAGINHLARSHVLHCDVKVRG